MKENIQKQLDVLDSYIKWIQAHLQGEKLKKSYQESVKFRRDLNKKKFALEGNPAAAMYGESQVGKSYLISSLLSEEGNAFSITDEHGEIHNFIEKINPIGGGNESTSLVSRFSVNYKPINTRFPIKALLLSPADILLVLCDSYYNDIKTESGLVLQETQIDSEVLLFKDKLNGRQAEQNYFTEDDVLDIRDYLEENFPTKANNLLRSSFFEELSLVVAKVKPAEWKDIFSILWNRNRKITDLFSALISEYEKLGFAGTVYLPMDSILRNYGTLLDVERLKEIYATSNRVEFAHNAETTLMLLEGGKERYLSFQKSYLCALAAELVFPQQESLLKGKPFLKHTDLLDFPGARGRMTLPESELNLENIPELLIRGKVAYLFNKYANAGKISIFVFCAKHEQAAQRSMPEMLNSWICKFIGDTPEKREKFIATSQIPPLFIVGTFFNVNLEYNLQHDKPDNLSSLNYRWNQRFERTLSTELLNVDTYKWFNDWTVTNRSFQNIFLLRDFVYSESRSGIFKGFDKNKRELEEVIPETYPDFRQRLRESFIEHDFVKRHFADPHQSWDEAAGINKDGTGLIISKLTVAAGNVNNALTQKIRGELREISEKILAELLKYFHSDDKDIEMQMAKHVAGNIQHKLDVAFSADGIKLFGKMMKEFMVDEGAVLELFRRKVDDIEHRDVINMDIYSTYRIQVPILENDTIDSYFERLCAHYEKNTDDQKVQFRKELERREIDLQELISGGTDLIKTNAQQLAEALLEYWFGHVTQEDKHTIRQILQQEGSTALQDIVDMFQKLFKKLDIAKKIAEKIRRHVDGHGKGDLPYEIIADMSAEVLNTCINTAGFKYLEESEISDLKHANERNKLGLVLEQSDLMEKGSVTELFAKIENRMNIIRFNPEEMKSLPSYRNYLVWYHQLKASFVLVCDIPSYDVQANERLGTIIRESKTIIPV